jgi:hypothetical protein
MAILDAPGLQSGCHVLAGHVVMREVPGVADNAEDFRFAEVLASYAYGNSPQSVKPPH